VEGKPVPNVEYKFTRVKSEPPIPNSERLKELGVARVSHGPGPYRKLMQALTATAQAELGQSS